MTRYGRLNDSNVVQEILVTDGDISKMFTPDIANSFHPVPDNVDQGWTYYQGTWVAPASSPGMIFVNGAWVDSPETTAQKAADLRVRQAVTHFKNNLQSAATLADVKLLLRDLGIIAISDLS